jgi:hypothetical protein
MPIFPTIVDANVARDYLMHLTTKDSDCEAQNARPCDRQPQTFFADRLVGDQGAFTTTTRPETRPADDSVDGKYHSTTGAFFNYGHRVRPPHDLDLDALQSKWEAIHEEKKRKRREKDKTRREKKAEPPASTRIADASYLGEV